MLDDWPEVSPAERAAIEALQAADLPSLGGPRPLLTDVDELAKDTRKYINRLMRLDSRLAKLGDAIEDGSPPIPIYSAPRAGYFVYQLRNPSLVYVGQSESIMTRLAGHRNKDWSEVIWQQVDTKSQMDRLEADLIHAHHPRYNKRCPRCGDINAS